MVSRALCYLFTVWVAVSVLPAFSQDLIAVKGKVSDGITGQPIADAHVYVNNTTRGTTTDSLGQFFLPLVGAESIELVVSVVGYNTMKAALKTSKRLTLVEFRMIPSVTILSEVEVKSKNLSKDWKAHYQIFKSALLGTSSNAENCEIVNPEALTFKTDFSLLSASSSSTLEVVNQALGYKVYVTLEKFEWSPSNYTIQTSNRFETIAAKNDAERERWRINRQRTYLGSQMHFFRSILDGRYSEAGFRISKTRAVSGISSISSYESASFEKKDSLQIEDILVDSARNHFRVFRKGIYQVAYVKKIAPKEFRTIRDYPFPVSWIVVPDSALAIDTFGEPLHPGNMGLIGYFDAQRIADMLPYDFYPEVEKILPDDILETGSVEGIVTDENGIPLESAEVFINHGLSGTTTDAWGHYQLKDLSPGMYDIGVFDGGTTPVKKTITVALGQDAKLDVTLAPRANPMMTPNGNQEAFLSLFKRKLLDKTELLLGQSNITNPWVLQFRIKKNKDIDIYDTAPLSLESSHFGYRWTYYINTAALRKIKGGYALDIDGVVKAERLSSDLKIRRWRWEMNRYDQYEGSLNHFVSALAEGRTLDEGFKVYQNTRQRNKTNVKFKSAKPFLKELISDSLLTINDRLLYLLTPKGLEIHSAQNQNKTKYYKHYRPFVYRIDEPEGRVVVSPNGYIAGSMNLGNRPTRFPVTLPADYRPPFQMPNDNSVLFLMDERNLARVRGKQERAYVQTDRPYYYPGDTIWFKVYMKYSTQQVRDSLSSVLYVDLVRGRDSIVANNVLKIGKGMAWGEIEVASNLPPGDYFIRAYTRWMLNFNECFWLHIPILSREYTIEGAKEEISSAPGDIHAQLTFDKTRYGPRENVTVSIQLSDTASLVGRSSLSVSVTDMSAVQEIAKAPTICSLSNGFKADRASMLRIRYPIEKAITLKGKILGPFVDSKVFAYLKGDDKPILAKLKGDEFEFALNFFDTTSVIIKTQNYNGPVPIIELESEDPVAIHTEPALLDYKLVKNGSNSEVAWRIGAGTKLLNEVVIKAKRISIPEVSSTLTQRRLGAPTQLYNFTTNPVLIGAVRKTNNLLVSLMAYMPDFGPTARLIRGGQVSPYEKIYTIMLDGVDLEYNQVTSTSASRISQIEVYKNYPGITPGLSAGGNIYTAGLPNVISLYNDNFVPIPPNFYRYQIRGYDSPSIFKVPSITSAVPDYRSTLYWNPTIETNDAGVGKFVFQTSDITGNYRIVVEGMTDDGRVFRHVEVLKID